MAHEPENIVGHHGCRFILSFDGHYACTLWQGSVTLAPNIGERKAPAVFLDQAKTDQVSHIARRQVLRLGNPSAMRRKVISSCGLSGATKPRSMLSLPKLASTRSLEIKAE
jgi:hypothetical protein